MTRARTPQREASEYAFSRKSDSILAGVERHYVTAPCYLSNPTRSSNRWNRGSPRSGSHAGLTLSVTRSLE